MSELTMSKKLVQYSTEFKAKVALTAIRGEETLPQLTFRYGIHTTQINSWKRHLIEQAAELFARSDGTGRDKGSIDDEDAGDYQYSPQTQNQHSRKAAYSLSLSAQRVDHQPA
ncbi:MAG: hypothetical protein E6Q62_07530 [Nitrosomonas sp.]|nr:MAG: hypothetical protein E6Q62_07530 [Nitrosomonas sp.]